MMDQTITRAARALQHSGKPLANWDASKFKTSPRAWAILLTSANHGTVGPLGSTFPHAGEHHERVVVVEVPAGAGAPSDEVNLVLRAVPAIGTRANTALEEQRIWQLYQEAQDQGTSPRGTSPTVHFARAIEREVAAQAGQVVVPEDRQALVNEALSAARELGDREYAHAHSLGKGGPGVKAKVLAAEDRVVKAITALAAPAEAQQAPAQATLAPAESIECWSHNEEDFNARSLAELVSDHELQPGATVWVGESVHPEPKSLFSTDWLIENMGEAAYDIAGEHAGEDYPNVSDEQVAELEALIVGWIAKCAPPNFWTVKNVRPYVLTAEDCPAQASTACERQEGGAA